MSPLGDNLARSSKVEHAHTLKLSNSTPRYILKTTAYVQQETYNNVNRSTAKNSPFKKFQQENRLINCIELNNGMLCSSEKKKGNYSYIQLTPYGAMSSKQHFSNVSVHTLYLGILLNADSDSVGQERQLKFCISNMFSDPRATL